MFIGRVNRRGFTLLEIIVAVAILATMAMAIYRFVQSNMVAIRASSDTITADARYDGLREVLTTQWQSLSGRGKGVLSGDTFKLNDRSRDEIRWVCGPGPGLMTRYAHADYLVSLRLQSEKDSDRLDLGFLRQARGERGLSENDSWILLIDNVSSLQIRYFDSRINTWVERWTDNGTLPRLVKVTVGRPDSSAPWEAIIPLARTPL